MNPAVLQRIVRVGTAPIKGAGIVLRRSSYRRRDFSTFILARKSQSYFNFIMEHNKQLLGLSSYRAFSSNPTTARSGDMGIYLFGVVTAVGMMGGIYYYSSSLKKTSLFQSGLDVLSNCPMVSEILGSEVQTPGLVRGKMNDKESKIFFVLKGKNGEFLVTLVGEKVADDVVVIRDLSMHKRGSIPVEEHYIYKDGVLVSNLTEDGEGESSEVDEVKEVIEEMKK